MGIGGLLRLASIPHGETGEQGGAQPENCRREVAPVVCEKQQLRANKVEAVTRRNARELLEDFGVIARLPTRARMRLQ